MGPQGRRWLYLATATDPGADAASTSDDTHRIAFGYSRGPDPRDLGPGWCHYAFDTDAQLGGPGSKDLEADPRLGHDDAHLIFGTNAYGPDKFRTARIFFTTKPGPVALTTCPERPPVPYFGTPANPLTTRRGPLAWTPVPATQDAAPAGAIVSAALDPATGRGDALPLWHID